MFQNIRRGQGEWAMNPLLNVRIQPVAEEKALGSSLGLHTLPV